nr:reverse transcriptase domain-containing protein [Tanacetum cinerariifolium]
MIACEVKGVNTRGGKTTTQDVQDDNTNVQPEEPPVVDLDKLVGSNEVLTKNQPQKTKEPVVQPSSKKGVPSNWTFEKRKRFFSQVKTYFWKEPYAFKLCMDNIIRRCVAGSETLEILAHCHSGPIGGHCSAKTTAKKVYESRFYWPSVFKDANEYVRRCDACQRSRNLSLRNEMPQNNTQVCEAFEV